MNGWLELLGVPGGICLRESSLLSGTVWLERERESMCVCACVCVCARVCVCVCVVGAHS